MFFSSAKAERELGLCPRHYREGLATRLNGSAKPGVSNDHRTPQFGPQSTHGPREIRPRPDSMTVSDETFPSLLTAVAKDIEGLIDVLLPASATEDGHPHPQRLLDAMRYASLNGGKRFRPFLVVATSALFNVPRNQALMVGAALECVHCYSLVHDDLPAMDDDDLRRGHPTAHKAFDQATAILAGDGLLTFAFEILGRRETHPDPSVRIELVMALACSAGLEGMVGGQMLDLAAEGRFADGKPQALDETAVKALQAMKTGALMRFACVSGGILGRASAAERAALERYGSAVGHAFQIADDLLDVEGDSATLGKATAKDAEAGKATLVSVLGSKRAKGRLRILVAEAEAALAPFGAKAGVLAEGARFVAQRNS
jgi:farnesyl diphosphate synthase